MTPYSQSPSIQIYDPHFKQLPKFKGLNISSLATSSTVSAGQEDQLPAFFKFLSRFERYKRWEYQFSQSHLVIIVWFIKLAPRYWALYWTPEELLFNIEKFRQFRKQPTCLKCRKRNLPVLVSEIVVQCSSGLRIMAFFKIFFQVFNAFQIRWMQSDKLVSTVIQSNLN